MSCEIASTVEIQNAPTSVKNIKGLDWKNSVIVIEETKKSRSWEKDLPIA
jgi:hypothetical protein